MKNRLSLKKSHPQSLSFSSFWDKLGIAASTLCLIDCLVLPIASLALMGAGATFKWAENMHTWLLPFITLTSSFAFYHSWRAHRSYGIVFTGLCGFIFLILGEFLEIYTFSFQWNFLSFVGSLTLIAAHMRNLTMHLRRRHDCAVHSG